MSRAEIEQFWRGTFGDEYVERNADSRLISSNIHLFAKILSRCTETIDSIIEFGSNIGLNLIALRSLLPHVNDISAIEINHLAMEKCVKSVALTNAYEQSLLDFVPDFPRDFVLIKGVLIHMPPEELSTIYHKIVDTSNKYICICEYYNPTPVEVSYRGNTGKLFKRDFCGEMLDQFPNLTLVDYGFAYHRDFLFPQDDLTWFLLRK